MQLLRVVVLLLSAVLLAASCSAQLTVDITFPSAEVTQGVAGIGWLIDIDLSALTAANSLDLAPPAFIPAFRNGAGTPFSSIHSPGVNPAAPGLVVLLSSSPNNNATLFGPLSNLAGLFEVNAPAVSQAGVAQFRLVWYIGATAFGEGVNSTLTVFVVSGTAPALLTTPPDAVPGRISNIASTNFSISGPVSLTNTTSAFTGSSTADPSALAVQVFSPAPGDTVGLDALNFAIDLNAVAAAPQFNPLLSLAAGYAPRFANASNATQTHTGSALTAPGVVVLINTTTLGSGASTNLAGLFQITALNSLSTAAGEVNELRMVWQTLKPVFGSGPARLTVFILNSTAPAEIVGAAEEQPGLISNVVVVDFLISSPAATVLGDPSFSGFQGQKPFQVHGIPGAVFNLLTAASLQLNALFSFIDRGHSMSAAEMSREHSHNAAALPLTPAWSHPGTYLTQLGLKIGGLQLLLGAGAYSTGLSHVTLVGEQRNLTVGETVRCCGSTLRLLDGWRVVVQTPLLSFTAVNADGFFNIEQARLLSASAPTQLDGLLGQSADQRWQAGRGSEWEQHIIMDFLVLDAQQQRLLSDEFNANRFTATSGSQGACAQPL